MWQGKHSVLLSKSTQVRKFNVGDSVWLSLPTASKLQPKWTGDWIVSNVKGDNT